MLGYSRGEVEEALATRDERLQRLEREASSLAERVLDRERRLQAALKRLGEGSDDLPEAPDAPGAITALSRRLEDIHAQARRQATRIRMRALRDAVQIADRMTELAGLREMLEASGVKPLGEKSEALHSDKARGNGHVNGGGVDGFFEGPVEIEIGPLKDFAQLSGVEDAAGEIGAAGEITVKSFSNGRATLAMKLSEPVELLREFEQRAPVSFHVRELADDRLILDVDADSDAAPDAGETPSGKAQAA